MASRPASRQGERHHPPESPRQIIPESSRHVLRPRSYLLRNRVSGQAVDCGGGDRHFGQNCACTVRHISCNVTGDGLSKNWQVGKRADDEKKSERRRPKLLAPHRVPRAFDIWEGVYPRSLETFKKNVLASGEEPQANVSHQESKS